VEGDHRLFEGFDDGAKLGLQDDDLKPAFDASVDPTDALKASLAY